MIIITPLLKPLLLLLLLLLHLADARPAPPAAFIKTSCTTTTYPNLCYTTLSTFAQTIQSDPKLLAAKSLSVALSAAKSASSAAWHLLRPRTTSRLPPSVSDCAILLADAIHQLQRSVAAISAGQDVGDVQTWASAAMTDQNTCMEELGGPRDMYGNAKVISLRKQVLEASQLTSNALALVSGYGSTRNRPRHPLHHPHPHKTTQP